MTEDPHNTRAWREPPKVSHAAIRRTMQRISKDSIVPGVLAALAERNAPLLAAGAHLCEGRDLRTGTPCTRTTRKRYLTGWRCWQHTPAVEHGRTDPVPDPASTLEGRRAAAGLDPNTSYTPVGPTLVDERAIASGKRRSTPEDYRAARGPLDDDGTS